LEIKASIFTLPETIFAGKYIEEYGTAFEVAGRAS